MDESTGAVDVPCGWDSCAAIILCGGRSSRMGSDKSQMPFGESTVLAHIQTQVAACIAHQIVVIGHGHAGPESFHPGTTLVRDRQPDLGPMEGLRVGLGEAQRRGFALAIVTTGDAPRIAMPLFAHMRDQLNDAHPCVAAAPFVDDTWHPLTAVYRTSLADEAAQRIADGRMRVKDIFAELPVVKLTEAVVRQYDPDLISIQNFNTPEEYRQIREPLSASRRKTEKP